MHKQIHHGVHLPPLLIHNGLEKQLEDENLDRLNRVFGIFFMQLMTQYRVLLTIL